MNQLLAVNTFRFAGTTMAAPPVTSRTVVASAPAINSVVLANPNLVAALIDTRPPLPASLPLMSSQNGNLFVDRNDASLHWHLPEFTLADDIDSGFAFTASQSGQDGSGNPFNTARLTLRMQKSKPADVVRFSQENPGAQLKEIPLAEMSAILTSIFTGESGQAQQRTFPATIQDTGNGDFLLIFDGSILGPSVIGLYQDLTLFGKAVISLTASYQAWSESGALFLLARRRQEFVRPLIEESAPMNRHMLFARMAIPTDEKRSVASLSAITPGVVTAQSSRTLVQTSQPWTKSLPLGLKYRQDGYQLKYTVSTATINDHVIRDAKDLKDFSLSQSEFAELKALGDVSQRYPTLSKLYIGVLSRTIVMIPKRYSIVRGRAGCAALCVALVDSSAAAGSKCKFEFDFTIAPEVSRIEVQRLALEISNREELKGYTLKLPDFQRQNPPSTLQTEFSSNVQFSAGQFPHTFALTVSIQDAGAQSPAVANANSFIMRLASSTGADLIGSLSLKLDDGFEAPVLTTIDLNFARTAGTDHEIDIELNEESAELKLTNQLPLDLQLSRYALIKEADITEFLSVLSLPANGSLSVPLPADHSGLTLAADAQLILPEPMKKSDIMKFLDIRTADVQETQYVIAVNGSGVNFDKVESLEVSITFSNLPNVAPRLLRLNKNVHADSTHIVIPLENAVFSLPGTVNLTVHFMDTGMSDLNFTVDNDFTSEPVLIILQTDIDKNLPKP